MAFVFVLEWAAQGGTSRPEVRGINPSEAKSWFNPKQGKPVTASRSPGLSFRSAAGWLGAGALLAAAWEKIEQALVAAQTSRQR